MFNSGTAAEEIALLDLQKYLDPLAPVIEGDDIVIVPGRFVIPLTGGVMGFCQVRYDDGQEWQTVDGLHRLSRQASYIVSYVDAQVPEIEDWRDDVTTLLRAVWGLDHPNAQSTLDFREDVREFAQKFARDNRTLVTDEVVARYLENAGIVTNSRGWCPYRAAPPLWAFADRLDKEADLLRGVRSVALTLGEIVELYLARIYRVLEMSDRVALQALDAKPFMRGGTSAIARYCGLFDAHAADCEKIVVRPHGQHMLAHDARDLREASETYAAGDLRGAIAPLNRLHHFHALDPIQRTMMWMLREVSIAERRKTPVTEDAVAELRVRTNRCIVDFPRLGQGQHVNNVFFAHTRQALADVEDTLVTVDDTLFTRVRKPLWDVEGTI